MTRKILLDNYYRYPLMRTQDFFKLLYQGEFGGAHACKTSQNDAAARILNEIIKIETEEEIEQPISEIISSTQLRVNLARFAEEKKNVNTLAEIFIVSAKTTQGDTEKFKAKIDVFESLVKNKEIILPYLSTRSAIIKYLTNIRPVSHSATYKLNYAPHYRVVMRDYFDMFPAINKINSLLNKDVVLVAIDGNSGSGKTYYSKALENYYAPRCNVFHADDFFLPRNMRSSRRLSQIGGNIHHERLERLLTDLKSPKPVVYQKYNCRTDTFAEAEAPVRQINIVEGVYSARENLIDKYDVVIKLSADRQTQQKRLLKRSGAKIWEQYDTVWLPLENKYFENSRFLNSVKIDTDGYDLYSQEN